MRRWADELSNTGDDPASQWRASHDVTRLFEQAARLVHGASYGEGLVPAQWAAMRYFAYAKPKERTVAALMRYQNMERSPVARTVRLLIEKGLLCRRDNPGDRRADLIELTLAGWVKLETDPARHLEAIVAALSRDQRASLERALLSTISAFTESQKGQCPKEH